ncbi:hypothetical protein [Mesorhizobium sp. 131-3-5]|uniref:hypothetical protein n=1 Tax=Mesorhizobium sp. 131-3-5 TaxID=2744520 RepID=UPI001927D736|nr:hypothetical protein [Mesorhizobium sp. 131-3-5]
MSTHGVQIFAKAVSQDHLSDDPLVGTHIANRILKAADNAKTAATSERAEAIEEKKIPSIGVGAYKDDVLHHEIANSLTGMVLCSVPQ